MSANVDEKSDPSNTSTAASSDETNTEEGAGSENVVAAEEAKLRSKYPNINRPMAGHSAFLQKRLAKGQKYFDSGDYQMAKQKPSNKSRMTPLVSQPTGEAIPTPESVPVRKTSLIQQSKLTTTAS